MLRILERGEVSFVNPINVNLWHFRTLVSRVKEIFRFPNKSESTRIVSWIGLFANNKASSRASGLLDTLCAKLEFMKYDEGERDLVTQVDRGVARWRGG